mgnify:CR=1 FL=1
MPPVDTDAGCDIRSASHNGPVIMVQAYDLHATMATGPRVRDLWWAARAREFVKAGEAGGY